jgi:hypothetical protein
MDDRRSSIQMRATLRGNEGGEAEGLGDGDAPVESVAVGDTVGDKDCDGVCGKNEDDTHGVSVWLVPETGVDAAVSVCETERVSETVLVDEAPMLSEPVEVLVVEEDWLRLDVWLGLGVGLSLTLGLSVGVGDEVSVALAAALALGVGLAAVGDGEGGGGIPAVATLQAVSTAEESHGPAAFAFSRNAAARLTFLAITAAVRAAAVAASKAAPLPASTVATMARASEGASWRRLLGTAALARAARTRGGASWRRPWVGAALALRVGAKAVPSILTLPVKLKLTTGSMTLINADLSIVARAAAPALPRPSASAVGLEMTTEKDSESETPAPRVAAGAAAAGALPRTPESALLAAASATSTTRLTAPSRYGRAPRQSAMRRRARLSSPKGSEEVPGGFAAPASGSATLAKAGSPPPPPPRLRGAAAAFGTRTTSRGLLVSDELRDHGVKHGIVARARCAERRGEAKDYRVEEVR